MNSTSDKWTIFFQEAGISGDIAERYVQMFAKNHIENEEDLNYLTKSDLEEMGIHSIDHQNRILNCQSGSQVEEGTQTLQELLKQVSSKLDKFDRIETMLDSRIETMLDKVDRMETMLDRRIETMLDSRIETMLDKVDGIETMLDKVDRIETMLDKVDRIEIILDEVDRIETTLDSCMQKLDESNNVLNSDGRTNKNENEKR